MPNEKSFFIKNKKYKILERFMSLGCIFEAGEELAFKGSQFVPYDEVWSYAFKNTAGKYKYLVVWNKDELKFYSKYFIENGT